MNPFEDVSRWPVGRYLREVASAQPDGRAMLCAGALNFLAGGVLATILVFAPSTQLASCRPWQRTVNAG
jgi:hypothetical protein